MLNFLAILSMLIAMFFSFGQGVDQARSSNCNIGIGGAVVFGLLTMLLILVR